MDGQGTLLVTEECLLNPNRNPDKSRSEIEQVLRDYLNVDAILWLDKGVYLDETSGHIDNFCRFVAPGEVVLTWTDDRNDPQYEISAAALERLQEAKDAHGQIAHAAMTRRSQVRDASYPSQASPAVTMQAIQLAHKGIDVAVPTVTGKPLTARANCSTATMEKINAARRA